MAAPLQVGQLHQDARLLQGQAPSRLVQAARQQGRGAQGAVPDEAQLRRLAGRRQSGKARADHVRRRPAMIEEGFSRKRRAVGPHEPGPAGARVDIVQKPAGITQVEAAGGRT